MFISLSYLVYVPRVLLIHLFLTAMGSADGELRCPGAFSDIRDFSSDKGSDNWDYPPCIFLLGYH